MPALEQVPETLPGLLARAAADGRGGLRFVDRREQESFLPWGEVYRRARGLAARLQEAGVEPGDRVALLFPTGEELCDAFFGTLLCAAVPAPLYPPTRLGRMPEYRRRTGALVAAAEASLALVALGVQRLLDGVSMPGSGAKAITLRELPAAPEGRWRLPRLAPEDLALIQFSSGSTSDPKPVALDHRALVTQARLLDRLWPELDGLTHRGVSWLPLYHDMGLVGCVLPALERPGELILMAPELFAARPALWLRAISRHRATISAAPDFGYAHCLERVRDHELEGVDLSCWRCALNGSETVSAATLRAFSRRFARWGFDPAALTPVYGLAEATLAVTFGDLEAPFTSAVFDRQRLVEEGRAEPAQDGREVVSVGRPLPGFALEIRDRDGRALKPGQVGRVWVRGPTLMRGYLGRPEASRRVLRDGWLDTGDRGFVRDAELYLVGRAKELVVLRGRNYAPEEIEEALLALPEVRAAVAASHLPDDGGSERLMLLVEVMDGRPGLEQRCRGAVLAALGLAAAEIVALPPGTLPRTSSGKLRRGEALRRHLAGSWASAPAAAGS